MKLRKSRIQRKGKIEIIPMIDVMFFLLATFILASLSLQRLDAIKVNLPQGAATSVQNEHLLTLSITANDTLLLDRTPVNLDQLPTQIKPLLDSTKRIVISADQHASHGAVVKAMLAASKGGVEHFLIAVEHE